MRRILKDIDYQFAFIFFTRSFDLQIFIELYDQYIRYWISHINSFYYLYLDLEFNSLRLYNFDEIFL